MGEGKGKEINAEKRGRRKRRCAPGGGKDFYENLKHKSLTTTNQPGSGPKMNGWLVVMGFRFLVFICLFPLLFHTYQQSHGVKCIRRLLGSVKRSANVGFSF